MKKYYFESQKPEKQLAAFKNEIQNEKIDLEKNPHNSPRSANSANAVSVQDHLSDNQKTPEAEDDLYATAIEAPKPHTYTDGAIYTGHFHNGLKHGHGKLVYPNGDIYEGLFNQGAKHGTGTLTFADGTRYEGQWQNDQIEGAGMYKWPHGVKYDGEFRGGRFHGKGTLTGQGERYEGEWLNGKRHGHGV